MSATHRASDYSEDEVQASTSHHAARVASEKISKKTRLPPTTAARKRKHTTIAPASTHKISSYELFGTDSEDDSCENISSQQVLKKPQPHHSNNEPGVKKSKNTAKNSNSHRAEVVVNSAREPKTKASARDVFGSDSDDKQFEQLKSGKKPPNICSYFTKRVPQGVSRQSYPGKDGSHYIELKVYRCDEIRNIQPMNRWRHAIITIKNQSDADSEAWAHLTQFIKATRQEFKNCRPEGFRQESFLKPYIDLNTSLRQSSKTMFEKDFFKLLNNSIFGKTIENKRKQLDVKLVTRWVDNHNLTNKHLTAEKLVTKPNLNSISIFSESFVAIQLNREKCVMDRPIYIGFSVLEYAKQHMYQFHYDFNKEKYKDRAQLCYTATDSLLYLIFTDDFYYDMRKNILSFDTSNFPSNNVYNIPKINEKVPGIFKDEMGGNIISEFIGLRAKLYCIKSLKSSIKKAKGITKSVTSNLVINDYKDTLLYNTNTRCNMKLIRCIKHVLYTQQMNKKLLDGNDDKRQTQKDNIHTLPWGHCDTIF